MARIWTRHQLDQITPPQVKDERGRAFLMALNRILADQPLPGPHMRDPETCPTAALEALVAEYSMEEFIEPGLPEHVVRRILKNRWQLQSLEGTDAGVQLGLSLLGMSARIEQWWQAEPKRAPNTHTLTFFVGEQLFTNGQSFFGSREKAAAQRMIDATKRWSQESTIEIGALLRLPTIRVGQHLRTIRVLRARFCVGQKPPRPRLVSSLAQTTQSLSVKRLRLSQTGGS